jgi:hypothetical protein
MTSTDIAKRFADGVDFDGYVAAAEKNADLYQDLYRTSVVPPDLVERARRLPGKWHLLVLSEDWCGDAVNALPILAKWVSAVPSFDLRILGREANPDLMNAHLTGESRSIPVVMIFDENFVERGWWGPRPSELQRWMLDVGLALEKGERYKLVRQWQARDRGRTTIEEVLVRLEAAARTTAPLEADSTSSLSPR